MVDQREEIATRLKIHSHSQIFRYSQSMFCLPPRPDFSDIFDWSLHWVFVVRVANNVWHLPCKSCAIISQGLEYFYTVSLFSMLSILEGFLITTDFVLVKEKIHIYIKPCNFKLFFLFKICVILRIERKQTNWNSLTSNGFVVNTL